jgi:5,10-methylenetetrahydromethanopterin reductase
MRIGLHSGSTIRGSIDTVVGEVRQVRERGLSGYWGPMLDGHDTLTLLAIAGREVPDVELGTSVVPLPLRPPFALAQQAASVQQASGNRLVLGIGPSHELIVRGTFGLEWSPPLAATRAYVERLHYIFSGADAEMKIGIPFEPPPFLLGAVNPLMAKLAVEQAAGVITWAAGPKTVEEVIMTALGAAPERSAPFRIVAMLPLCVTDDADSARAMVHKWFGRNDSLPMYQKVLAREGVGGMAELALIGGEDEVSRRLDEFAACGVTDFAANLSTAGKDADRTWDFLAARAALAR